MLPDHPDSVLIIAGREGDATSEIQRAICESGAGPAVRMLGHRTDVDDLYVAADIFVFPSHYEGLGCSLLEAMALSTPIIGSDAAAISEVLGDGSFGLIVRRNDIGALAGAMRQLLDEPGRGVELATQAVTAFDEYYELDGVANRTADLYARVTHDGAWT